jgi:hypothetical protein
MAQKKKFALVYLGRNVLFFTLIDFSVFQKVHSEETSQIAVRNRQVALLPIQAQLCGFRPGGNIAEKIVLCKVL